MDNWINRSGILGRGPDAWTNPSAQTGRAENQTLLLDES